jgi:hypothetical protein
LKTAEWAKYLKKARNICDIGVKGSLVAGVCCEFLKKFMSEYQVSGDYTCQFHGSPDLGDLSSMFRELWSGEKNIAYHYFSDDSCVSFKCRDGYYRCNMDISSADSSHYSPIFDILRDLSAGNGHFGRCMLDCLSQLTLPLLVRDCDNKPLARITPSEPVLYSGSTLTTLINNFSQLYMFSKLKLLSNNHTVDEVRQLIPVYMSQIGYSVTVQDVDVVEDFQFLKFSCDREYQPFINLGPFLRMLGWSKRDIPKALKGERRRSLKVRSEYFEAAKIFGYRGMGRSKLYDLLAEKYSHIITEPLNDRYHRINVDTRVSCVTICNRYKITPLEWESLLHIVSSVSTNKFRFTHIRHSAVDKIMSVDYGYGKPENHDFI